MTSETRRVAGPGLLGFESLIPGQDHEYETVIKDSDGNVIATGRGINPEESQRIAREKVEALERKHQQAVEAQKEKERKEVWERERQQAAREEEREQQRRTVSSSVQGRPTSLWGNFTTGYRLGDKLGKLAVIILTFVFFIPGIVLNKLFPDKHGNDKAWLHSFLFWSFVGATIYLQRKVGTSIWVFGIQLVLLSLVNIAVGVIASECFLKPKLPLVVQAAFVKLKPMQLWIGWSAFVIGLFCLIWSLADHRSLSGLMPELSAITAGLMLIRPIPPRIETIKSSLGLACIVIALFYLIFGWKWNVASVYQIQAEVNSVVQPQAKQPEKEQPAETAKPRAAQPAVAQSKPIEKQDEEELNPHAEDLYQMAVVESKIAKKPMMSYQRMVNYCRQILELYPNTSYAPKARELLRQVPEDKRSRYHITNEEMGL